MRRPALLLLALSLAGPAFAQTTPLQMVNRANRLLEQDRARDSSPLVRGALPPGPESMRAMEDDRRSLGPGVGRPETAGRYETGGERGALTGGMNPQR